MENQYNNEKVTYLKEQIEGNQAFINTQVVMKDKNIPINYVMIKRDQWMVYDVVVEGVSLVKNYRDQFRDILAKDQPEEVLKILRERAAK